MNNRTLLKTIRELGATMTRDRTNGSLVITITASGKTVTLTGYRLAEMSSEELARRLDVTPAAPR